ncbi:MAG: hypothetical protein HY982_00415 [Candidatus Magasanikbacteria bacterium]|nr:hypothetical protein [Candidatus Magasanikbacteria bacterium]
MNELKAKIQLLKKMREACSPSPEWLGKNREILMMQVKNTIRQKQAASFNLERVWSFLNIFLPRHWGSYVARPVLTLAVIVGLVFGSWVTTVSASYNSLPGDVLYPVKLATESMQTSLASKPQEIKLRMEFASRRAQEVKTIVKSNASKKGEKVEEAVKHLKKDLDSVKSSLEVLKKEPAATSPNQAVEMAKAVEQKTNEIQKSLDQTKTEIAPSGALTASNASSTTVGAAPSLKDGAAPSMAEKVKEASVAVGETGVKAVEVIVEKHQEDKSSISKEEIKNIIDNKLKTAGEKVGKIEEQMNAAATSTPNLTSQEIKEQKETKEKITEPVKETTAAAKSSLQEAKTELAKDNLNGAVDKLREANMLTQAAEVKAEATRILIAPVSETIKSQATSTGIGAGASTGAGASAGPSGTNGNSGAMAGPAATSTEVKK